MCQQDGIKLYQEVSDRIYLINKHRKDGIIISTMNFVSTWDLQTWLHDIVITA